MATTTRRIPPRKHAKTPSVTADQLADELAKKLTIANVKGKQKAKEGAPLPEEPKLTAMRSVNTASQALSSVVQAGWKQSSADSSRVTLNTVNSSAAQAAKHLGVLRRLCPNDFDVERAAASVLGKLMVLEMYDLASLSLSEMHPRLCSLLNAADAPHPANNELSRLSIPVSSTNPTILNLLSVYLLNALVLACRSENAQELATFLSSSTTHSLLAWLPHFSTALPTKQVDSMLTRAYSSLTKLCSAKPKATSPEALFLLRTYALRCLIQTSSGVIEANTFWDQATRFSATLAKSATTEEQATRLVLDSYSELSQLASKRGDKEVFMAVDETGKSFVAFCDQWAAFAKRAGDISLLQKINALLHQQPSSSSSNLLSPTKSTSDRKTEIVVEGRELCNTLVQLCILLENIEANGDDELLRLTNETIAALKTSPNTSVFLTPKSSSTEPRSRDEEEVDRICGKVDRAVERVRRVGIKLVEQQQTASSLSPKVNDALRELLLAFAISFETLLASETLDASATRDALTRSLDTLFVLSRVKLSINDPRTFVAAFEHLAQASSILDQVPPERYPTSPADDAVDLANYTRCVSGAFYNIAGTLYQASRYGNAVPFLVESCALGSKALRLPRISLEVPNESREKEWKLLEEQLFRRWELLAVCYSKNGDRMNAYDAFKQAIITFPFASSGLTSQAAVLAPDALFGPSCTSAVKQLVTLVDRISYIGACELLLPPEEVSLRLHRHPATVSTTTALDVSVVGALLERQLDSLESSRWKEGVGSVFLRLLKDALEIYDARASDGSRLMPVRRARVVVRALEFMYRHSSDILSSDLGFVTLDAMLDEVQDLGGTENFGNDSSLGHFAHQYRIAANLWVALLAHRRADPEQNTIMTQRSEEACRLIKELLALNVEASKKVISPKTTRKSGSSKVARIVSPKATRTTRQKMPAAPKKAAPVRKLKAPAVNPVTPKTRTRTALQPVTFNSTRTPPRKSAEGEVSSKATLVFDDFQRLLSLLQLSARILGFLSLILAKAHILDMTRKLTLRQSGPTSDGYVIGSLDLAHQYLVLGKLKRASSVFNQALEIVRDGKASQEVSIRFLLRFAELLVVFEDIPKSSAVYLEALDLSSQLDLEPKGLSTQQRIHARAKTIEMSATAAYVFASLQYAKGNVGASLEGSLQSLRLWSRAADTLTRLRPTTPSGGSEADPFEMTSLKDALPASADENAPQALVKSTVDRRPPMDGLEWRISEGLLSTMFSLIEAYHLRGSAREAEYFARQAAGLAGQLNAPAMVSRALARQGEIQLYMGQLTDAHANLAKAASLLCDMPGLDSAEIRRLQVEYNSRLADGEDGEETFDDTLAMLSNLDDAFRQFDDLALGPRKSLGTSPSATQGQTDVLAPDLLASILSQQLWSLRDEIGDVFDGILEKFMSLSYSNRTKAEENALMAKLTLHSVYGRFRADMFLSSLTESTIAIPMGMESKELPHAILSSKDVVDALANAEKLLWSHLDMTANTGNVIKVREAVISLVLVSAFRTSLGERREDMPSVIAALLDASAALTLRRDMLEAIDHKFPPQCLDDLQWPSVSADGSALPRPVISTKKKLRIASLSDSDEESDEDEDDATSKEGILQTYWASVRARYQAQILSPSPLSSSETASLPSNWTVVNISVTTDKSTLFCSRREGGVGSADPLIFCIPLKERREHGSGDEEEHLTFDGAIRELQDIIRCSDECTKSAINVKSGDEEARSNWWKQRVQLDVRMRELLENIEYCWLGAFKTILSPRSSISEDHISELRSQFEKVFHQCLHVKDKKLRKPVNHKKNASQAQTHVPTQFTLDDRIVKCFSYLSPKCRDEELEDFIYFVLDLYQFHGVPVAIAEVDIDQVVVDLRSVLEDHALKTIRRQKASKSSRTTADEHVFLVLDKNVQGLPWESIPILRGRSVSRIPGVDFLHDRLTFAKCKREAAGEAYDPMQGAVVDPRKGYYILNPSGDLGGTQERFRDWASGMKKAGWDGTIGQAVSEQQFVNGLKSQDLVVYFGHGGGEQYVRSHKVRTLPSCAATMLWGCSSGTLRDMGDFDRTGTPYNYMLAGCPTLVANLWDVTDKEIDKISQAVFDKLSLKGDQLLQPSEKLSKTPTSLVTAVAQARDSCKLKYLTGAAPVVYGIPFYL